MALHLKNTKKGFTLIELIAVVSIIMILALLLVPNVIGYINKSKIAVVKNDAKTVLNVIKTARASSPDSENIATYDDAVDNSKGGDSAFKTSKDPAANLKNADENELQAIIDNNSSNWDIYKEYYGN
ncbi:type IV pilin protein [Clostridium guangxiense]|uniref:type IV pilin protein n=1 Tax=Clostridium guangxiense TaxID=1662055 RepID=UPI001E551E8E|nr:type II secretion system protein [Clostridium guangxiense]MCD2346459.1 type II secretion system GspH family protein [Clostridium guangxiense]